MKAFLTDFCYIIKVNIFLGVGLLERELALEIVRVTEAAAFAFRSLDGTR
jgi:hypothetical protein